MTSPFWITSCCSACLARLDAGLMLFGVCASNEIVDGECQYNGPGGRTDVLRQGCVVCILPTADLCVKRYSPEFHWVVLSEYLELSRLWLVEHSVVGELVWDRHLYVATSQLLHHVCPSNHQLDRGKEFCRRFALCVWHSHSDRGALRQRRNCLASTAHA